MNSIKVYDKNTPFRKDRSELRYTNYYRINFGYNKRYYNSLLFTDTG